MNGTLQLREVSSITSDINDINDINIKDIESDIMNKFGSTYKPSYEPSFEKNAKDVAASNIEAEPNIDDVLEKAKKDIQDITGTISTEGAGVYRDNVIPDEIMSSINKDSSNSGDDNDDDGEVIISAKETVKEEEKITIEEPRKKGFWGKLFSKN